MNNKVIIVGAGLFGSVLARRFAEKDFIVEIFEKRNHIGGNIYDYIDSHGIRVHRYGPHIFHTNYERVWEFLSKYTNWTPFRLVCGSVIDGKCVRTSFDFHAVDTFFEDKSKEIKRALLNSYPNRTSVPILELLESKNILVQKFASFLYKKDYVPYTCKQWGVNPAELDQEIFRRVPVLLSYNSNYFTDRYQAIPSDGYTKLIKNLLNHPNIQINLNKNAEEFLRLENSGVYHDSKQVNSLVFYSGPIDEFLKFKFGKLPYRSLKFEWKYLENIDSYQEYPVVAYPQEDGFTRITEYKKLPLQNIKGTSIAFEYPIHYSKNNLADPYYPILTSESHSIYDKYKEYLRDYKNFIPCGRLGDFKYYNMDQAVLQALELADRWI